ncbi:ATP-binding protein [Gordonibacter sp.]|uniref:ATP-binding protein n=1 Tax=Gordonibacter sp. TaxID=1968902 RepID=UPI002FCAD164
MLTRKIESKLAEWKRTKTKQGLLITGARQVGKTSSVEKFATEEYSNLIKIDFVEAPSAVKLISEARDIEDLIVRITSLASRPLPNEKTLLFFDEVQRCGDAITWMRYLADDGRFDVIYSGSLLGIEAYDFRSLPVGTIDIVEMFPLDFEEFCWANGLDGSLWDIVAGCFASKTPVPDFLHERFMDLFRRYVLVGGMPEAVHVFVSTNDTQAMRARQKSILDAYRADITRYADNKVHAQRIKTIFNAIPAQLGKENRRFVVSGIEKKKRFADMASDFGWLENAGVVIPARKATEATFPLGLSQEQSFFKLYQSDVGLLFSTFEAVEVRSIIENAISVNFGAAFENAVAQELRAHGREALFYYYSKKIGEVDFLLQQPGSMDVIPVEVKSGSRSHSHAALDNLMRVPNYRLSQGCVLHPFNVENDGLVDYLPLYMAGLL